MIVEVGTLSLGGSEEPLGSWWLFIGDKAAVHEKISARYIDFGLQTGGRTARRTIKTTLLKPVAMLFFNNKMSNNYFSGRKMGAKIYEKCAYAGLMAQPVGFFC